MFDAIEIVLPGETFRLTTAGRDLEFEGNTYLSADARLVVGDDEAVLSLTGNHPLAQRSARGGTRPKQADVNVIRVDVDGQVRLRWSGQVVSLSFGDTRVELHAQSLLSLALSRSVGVVASRTCTHQLFGAGCCLDQKAYARRAVITAMEHATVAIDIWLEPHWARGGEFIHAASGERIEILEQDDIPGRTGSRIVLHSKSYNARVGDEIDVTPGCDREIATCHSKFNNRQNFGGFPHLPTSNPFHRK